MAVFLLTSDKRLRFNIPKGKYNVKTATQTLELAERTDAIFVIEEMRRHETRQSPVGLFRSAWAYAEYALCRSHDITDDERAWHLNGAQDLLGRVIGDLNSLPDIQLGALVLSAYMPMFKKRCFSYEAKPSDSQEIYRGVGAAMRYLRPLAIDAPLQWRMTEMILLALSARTQQPDYLLYPASPREEASALQPYNHDSYFVGTDIRKLPIQQKLFPTERVYDPSVTMLSLGPILNRALCKQFGKHELTVAEQVNYVISCIVSECAGQEIDSRDCSLLNNLSEAVVRHYRDALEYAA